MNVKKEELQKSEIKLTIELSAEEFAPFVEKATKKFANEIEIKGFRKGHAPLDVVKEKVGEMPLHQEAAELAVRETLGDAVEQEHLHTVGQPAIGVEKLAPGNPFVYTAVFPVLPSVTLPEMAKIKVEKKEVETTDEEVDRVLENLQNMRAKEVAVDREAKMGDKVEINFDVYLDSIPVDGGKGMKHPLILGEETMIPGFEEQVVGMKKGEEKEFKLSFPEKYHNERLAGKECEFKVKLESVFDRELPELNDDFAKEIGEYKVMGELRDAIKKNIGEEKQQKEDQRVEREMMEALIEKASFGEIPDVMLNQESQQMMQELQQNIMSQGLEFEKYLQHLKKDRKQLMLDFAPDAVKRIKSALIIRAVAEQEKITANEEEVKKDLEEMAKAYEGNEQWLKHVRSKDFEEYQKIISRNKATLKWLKEQMVK